MTERGLEKKAAPGRLARLVRLLGSAVDPRAWAHAVKLINYYNYSHVEPLRKISVGRDCAISPNAVFSNPTRIVIGERVRIGARCHLWAGHSSGTIRIGDDCLFGPEVMVTAASYRYNDGAPVTEQLMDEDDVLIGKDVWLATRVIVLPGARIGDGCVIAAGAVVKGELPPFSIAAGAPARVVGYRIIGS